MSLREVYLFDRHKDGALLSFTKESVDRPPSLIVTLFSTEQEVPGSILSSSLGFLYSGELLSGMYGPGVSMVSSVHILTYYIEGGLCTLLSQVRVGTPVVSVCP